VETENWFGPLFTAIKLTRTNSPVEFHPRFPLLQAQPLMRQCYRDPPFKNLEMTDLGEADWKRLKDTLEPNTGQMRMLGHYAVGVRKGIIS
jgi:hypothetical protein